MSFGKVGVVTGGSKGIGKAIADMLLGNEYRVAVIDVHTSELEQEAEREIKDGKLRVYNGSIGDDSGMKSIFASILKDFGQIDVLVNNAGILSTNTFVEETLLCWEQIIDINLTGTFICTKYAVESMIRMRKGCIVNIVSISGLKESVFSSPAYCASKSGIIGMARCLAANVAKYNIRVNNVAPSTTTTSMVDSVNKDVLKIYKNNVPLGRLAEPKDIANAVEFLISDKAEFITGETMNVNGGLYMP